MNLADVIIVFFVLALGARGYFRGFLRELFGLAAWLGGAVAAHLLAPEYTPFAGERTGMPPAIAQAIAFLAIFFLVYLACRLAGAVLARVARALFLAPVDHAAGLFLGAAKGLVIAALLCMLVTSRRGIPDATEAVQNSALARVLVDGGWAVLADVHRAYGSEMGAFEKQLRGAEKNWLKRFGPPKTPTRPAAEPAP